MYLSIAIQCFVCMACYPFEFFLTASESRLQFYCPKCTCPGRAPYFTEIASYIHIAIQSSEAGYILMYALVAEPEGEASNCDELSSPVCIYVCMYVCMYICISVPVNPRHLDCTIARCSPQALTTTKCSTSHHWLQNCSTLHVIAARCVQIVVQRGLQACWAFRHIG